MNLYIVKNIVANYIVPQPSHFLVSGPQIYKRIHSLAMDEVVMKIFGERKRKNRVE